MKLKKGVVVRYSESFKQEVIAEVESGRMNGFQASKRYGISPQMVSYWMKRMGKLDSLPKIIRVEKPDEKDRIKQLERQVLELKNALADTQVRYLIAESQLEIVCEQQGLDAEEIKKKTKSRTIIKTVAKGSSVNQVCRLMKRSRQSYYKARKAQQDKFDHKSDLLSLVQPIRHLMPRIGGRKLHFLIKDSLQERALKMGRDQFFRWLREHDLLIRPKKSYVVTTQSRHRFWVHSNLIKQIKPTKPNNIWVSDITYIRTLEGFCYLALITDAYSRKIVGYDISDSLELDGCLRALQSATQTAGNLDQLIHHSDRGFQYCSHAYTDLLKQRGIKISMAAKGDCYENALAERVNGILKDEFNLDLTFKNKSQAIKTVHQSIYIYNMHRPHWSINLRTPNAMHAA
jgi:transposase InsO family protein/transposase-like protein